MPRLPLPDAIERFTAAPVARLATVDEQPAPHLVPVVFAVELETTENGTAAVIYTAVDGKPKSTSRLQRLTNIIRNPRVSLLVDRYGDDWNQLWWVRADGSATVHDDDATLETARPLLRRKYPQYRDVPIDGPVIRVTVARWSSWSARHASE